MSDTNTQGPRRWTGQSELSADWSIRHQPRRSRRQTPEPPKWSELQTLDVIALGKRIHRAIDEAAGRGLDVRGEKHELRTLGEKARWLNVVPKTLERWRRADHLPTAKQLFVIGQRTGESVDSLLGFEDVPRRRNERAAIGALSSELLNLTRGRRPAAAYEPELAEGDPGQFAERLVDEWWRWRLLARAREGASKFRQLADEILKAGRRHDDPESVLEATYTVNQCRWVAVKLESDEVTWEDVDFRFPSRASQHVFRRGKPQLATPFPVLEGWAYLWRYADYDLAVYIKPGTGWGAIGDVCVKRGTNRRPQFLVETEWPGTVGTRWVPRKLAKLNLGGSPV